MKKSPESVARYKAKVLSKQIHGTEFVAYVADDPHDDTVKRGYACRLDQWDRMDNDGEIGIATYYDGERVE